MRILKGKVVTGVGNFSYWIAKLQDHYRNKTSMQLYPGTLNIQLGEPFEIPPASLQLKAEEYGGTRSINIVPCKIFGRRAVILRTDTADNDPLEKMIIEVACEVKLRDAHQLVDGDVVEVEVVD